MIEEYSIVWNQTDVKARKEHRCSECPFPIEPKETYIRIGSMHKLCYESGEMSDHCHSIIGEVYDDLRDCDIPRGHPARRAWGRHLWRFRKQPKAKELRLKTVLDDCCFEEEL
jgi:hypothetical protein